MCYIVIRNTPEGLYPSSAPAVYTTVEEAKVEAVRRMLENGGNQVVFKALSSFQPHASESEPVEDLKQNFS
tara:strand:- start:172 stop:384 length:213 start_codon:yes stop_codon:yes gene_type:complete